MSKEAKAKAIDFYHNNMTCKHCENKKKCSTTTWVSTQWFDIFNAKKMGFALFQNNGIPHKIKCLHHACYPPGPRAVPYHSDHTQYATSNCVSFNMGSQSESKPVGAESLPLGSKFEKWASSCQPYLPIGEFTGMRLMGHVR